jgi:hypothetical protein
MSHGAGLIQILFHNSRTLTAYIRASFSANVQIADKSGDTSNGGGG